MITKEKRPISAESKLASNIIFFTLLFMALGTLLGLWIKWFWIGYVFVP